MIMHPSVCRTPPWYKKNLLAPKVLSAKSKRPSCPVMPERQEVQCKAGAQKADWTSGPKESERQRQQPGPFLVWTLTMQTAASPGKHEGRVPVTLRNTGSQQNHSQTPWFLSFTVTGSPDLDVIALGLDVTKLLKQNSVQADQSQAVVVVLYVLKEGAFPGLSNTVSVSTREIFQSSLLQPDLAIMLAFVRAFNPFYLNCLF